MMKARLLVLLMPFFMACAKDDPCENTVCYNGGTCSDGSCVCGTWYEGSDCSTEWRAKFLGKYNGVLTSGTTQIQGAFTISEISEGPQYIDINGIWGYFKKDNKTSFVVPLQNYYSDGYTYQMEGGGSFNGNQLVFNIRQSIDGQNIVLSFVGTK